MTVDDTAYWYFARQAAADPTDPYGFKIHWYNVPQPANDILAPPVLPYWWSLALRLGLDEPWMWKLWMFPFALLFTVAVYVLARRFAGGLALPLTVMTVLSEDRRVAWSGQRQRSKRPQTETSRRRGIAGHTREPSRPIRAAASHSTSLSLR